MGIQQIVLPILIYLVIFFLIEKVSFKKDDKFKSKLIYAIGFVLLIIIINVLAMLGDNPPHVGITIYQITIAVIISVSYIFFEYNRR